MNEKHEKNLSENLRKSSSAQMMLHKDYAPRCKGRLNEAKRLQTELLKYCDATEVTKIAVANTITQLEAE